MVHLAKNYVPGTGSFAKAISWRAAFTVCDGEGRHRQEIDVVIDEVNTLPFLSRLVAKDRVVVWMHQLAREVLLAEAPPLVGIVGYLLEPLLMWPYHNVPVVTISESSARSFQKFGLRGSITVAEIALDPPDEQPSAPHVGRIGYVGRLTPSKRVDHIIRAVALLRERVPGKRELDVVGNGSVIEKSRLRALVNSLGLQEAVHFFGHVSRGRRDEIMRSLDVLAMSSMREGWGLVVSEAARFGVPSVAYPVAGLIDSIQDGVTGIIAEAKTPEALAESLERIIANRTLRTDMGRAAMAKSAAIRRPTIHRPIRTGTRGRSRRGYPINVFTWRRPALRSAASIGAPSVPVQSYATTQRPSSRASL